MVLSKYLGSQRNEPSWSSFVKLQTGGDFYLARPDPALKYLVQLNVLEKYGLRVLCNQGWASLFFDELIHVHQMLGVATEKGFVGPVRDDCGRDAWRRV